MEYNFKNYELLCWTPETCIILYINFTSIKTMTTTEQSVKQTLKNRNRKTNQQPSKQKTYSYQAFEKMFNVSNYQGNQKEKTQYFFTVSRMAIAKDMSFYVLARVWNKENIYISALLMRM